MSSPSASPALSCGKRKRKSVSTPRTPQAIVPAGTDLSILVKPKEFGGIVHQLQPAIIPEIISRFGFGWQCAAINKELPLVIRSAIVRGNIGGYGPVYDQLRDADPVMEMKMVRKLRSSQAHCVKSHHGRLASIVKSLFTSTEDELVKTVKSRVFGVENGEPILAPDHPVLRELATLSNGACAWRLACLCFALTLAPPPSCNRQARAFRE